jgi:hypothetical protein
MKSNLESVPDKILLKILRKILNDSGAKNISNFIHDLEEGEGMQKEINSMTKVFGSKDEWVDIDYITSLIGMNFGQLKSGEDFKLERPELKKYDLVFRVNLVEYKTDYWKHRGHEYYSKDSAYMMTRIHSNNGNIDYWEGDLVDSDIYDSDTNEISIDDISQINESRKNKKPLSEGASKIIETKSLDDLFKMRHLIEEEIKLRLK